MNGLRNICVLLLFIAIVPSCTSSKAKTEITPDVARVKTGENYNFSTKQLVQVKSLADISFLKTSEKKSPGITIKARRIKDYGKENPQTLSLRETTTWGTTAGEVGPDRYYIVKGTDNEFYLIKIVSVTSSSVPEISFKWLKIDQS